MRAREEGFSGRMWVDRVRMSVFEQKEEKSGQNGARQDTGGIVGHVLLRRVAKKKRQHDQQVQHDNKNDSNNAAKKHNDNGLHLG